MNSKLIEVPELLAPAGNLDTAVAALENGADAVYAGLKKFNARERTQNFTIQEMSRLIRFAHKNGKKVYITFNTLIKETELEEAFSALEELDRLRPDAVIIQDLGVLGLIGQYFPNLEPHASTQMGFHNSSAVNTAEELGISRVILERQVTYDEIKLIRESTDIELEVFIHGALCCSLSGVCLFSSWMGGWSGNRGKCKQPCRRRYHTVDGNGFFFSTNDLYSLDAIPELKTMGISSLKIEGRLKKSDYVVPVVQAYRMMLDASEADSQLVLKEAKLLLSQAAGRYWSKGFRHTEDFSSVVNYRSVGVSGAAVGTLLSVEDNGFTVLTKEAIRQGDKLRVQPKSGDEGPSFTVTKMTMNGELVYKIPANSEGKIYCDKQVPAAALVFKTGRTMKDYTSRLSAVQAYELAVDMDIEITEHEIAVKIEELDFSYSESMNFPLADTHALEVALVEKEFRKLQIPRLELASISVKITGDLFVQQKTLRKFRQNLEAVLKDVELSSKRGKTPFIASCSAGSLEKATVFLVKKGAGIPTPGIKAQMLFESDDDVEELLIPNFISEQSQKSYTEEIMRQYQRGVRRFRFTSLYDLKLIRRLSDARIIMGFPFPVCNTECIAMLERCGFHEATIWPELEEAVLQDLAKKAEASCFYTFGRLPILQSRAELAASGRISDSRGGQFHLEKSQAVTSLYPDKAFRLPDTFCSDNRFYDLRYANLNDEFSEFNFHRELV